MAGGNRLAFVVWGFSVSTRLPPEYQLTPADAVRLLQEEVFNRMTVLDLSAADRPALWQGAVRERLARGRIYDSQIEEVAHAARAAVIVTDNPGISSQPRGMDCEWKHRWSFWRA